MSEWKDVLAVYVAKVSNGNNQVEMMTLSDEKVSVLKDVFWAMNEITFTKDVESHQETIIHLTWTEHKTVTHTKLHININHKTANEMAEQYNFNQELGMENQKWFYIPIIFLKKFIKSIDIDIHFIYDMYININYRGIK